MKDFIESVGIDVSKQTIDAHLHCVKASSRFPNNKQGFKMLLAWIKSHVGDLSKAVFCFEHTGVYSISLAKHLSEHKVAFAMVPALQIKRSLGLVRGKNDVIDAIRIAEYCYLRRNNLKQTILPSDQLLKIKALLGARERMVAQRAGFLASRSEMKIAFNPKELRELLKPQEQIEEALNKAIKALDKKVLNLIEDNPETKRLYDLVTSVKGIGPVIAAHLIVTTNCFTAFSDSRKLACYCGIAPFEKQSGTSIRSRSRVSHYANKKLKVLMNLAASNVISTDPEIKAYYQRRIQEGKSKMSTLNIVRNKLLHRVFAVIKRGTPFVEIHKWAA